MTNVMRSGRQAREALAQASGSETLLGVLVAWDIGSGPATGVRIPRELLGQCLREHGFGKLADRYSQDLPAHETLDQASHVSFSRFATDRGHYSVTKLQAERGVAVSYGVMVRSALEEDASARVGARVRVGASGRPEVLPAVDGWTTDGALRVASAMAANAEDRMATATNSDLVEMLAAVRAELRPISLRRNGGGAYFVREGAGARCFVGLLESLEDATSAGGSQPFVPSVTVVHGDERSLRTWMRQTQTSFSDEFDALVEALKVMTSRDNVRETTWDARTNDVTELMLRARDYEALLGDYHATLQAELAQLSREYEAAKNDARMLPKRGVVALEKLAKAAGLPRDGR